jgi:pimeloyl-ACP methyl ester carboxylesterase
VGSRTGSTTIADGARITWRSWPGGGAQTVVLVHGIGNDGAGWFDIPDAFAAHGWSVLAVDLRGHGKSSRLAPFSVEQMAADLAVVLRAMPMSRPLLVGHSLGALVCNAAVAQYQAAACGIINLDQPLRLAEFAGLIRSLWPSLRADFRSTVVPLFDAMLAHGLPPAQRVTLQSEFANMDAEVALGIWLPLAELELPDIEASVDSTVRAIRLPYLAVHGSNPGNDYQSWLRQRIPAAELVVWEGSLHFPHLVHPERFVACAIEFATAAA